MEFRDVDREFAELRQRVADGEASGSELDEWRGRNFALDSRGRRWGKGSTVDEWYFDSGSKWTLGVPPGYPLLAGGQVFHLVFDGEHRRFWRVMDFFPLNGRVYGLFADIEGDGAEQAIRRVGGEDRELEIEALEDEEFEKVLAHFQRRDASSSIGALRQEDRVITVLDSHGAEHHFRMIDAICLEGGVYGLLLRLGDGQAGDDPFIPVRLVEEGGGRAIQFMEADAERNRTAACFETRRWRYARLTYESGGKAVPEDPGEWIAERVVGGELLREAAMPLHALAGGVISIMISAFCEWRDIPPDMSPVAPAEMLAFLEAAQRDPDQLATLVFHDGVRDHGVAFTKVEGNPTRVYFDDPYGNDSMLGAGNNQIGVASREEFDGHSISEQEFEESIAAVVSVRLWREQSGAPQEEDKSPADAELHDRLFAEATQLVDGELLFDDAGSRGKPGWMARRKLKKAVPVLERVLQIRPSNWSAMFVLGKIHQRLEQSGESLRWFSAAHEANPGQPDVAREAAFAALNLGRANEAVSLCLSAVSANPDDAGLIANLALAHLLARDLASAVERAREAISAGRTTRSPPTFCGSHRKWTPGLVPVRGA